MPLWHRLSLMRSLALNFRDRFREPSAELVAPDHLFPFGRANFVAVGQEFFEYFRAIGGLHPGDRVLDVGCSSGRMAVPMTAYLTGGGAYEGFDIAIPEIQWCKRNISSRFPNFRFQRVDIRNKSYNPYGRDVAATFRFPYADATFDFVFLTSVFTHLLPEEVENYLAEIARVLKPGGRCFGTWFLLNTESEAMIRDGKSTLDFRFSLGDCLTTNAEIPEQAIAFRQTHVADLHRRHGLDLDYAVHPGSWCGRTVGVVSYQDICVARKRSG